MRQSDYGRAPGHEADLGDRVRERMPDTGGGEEVADWVEPAARIGYAAKGAVYAVVGALAAKAAIGAGGQTVGSRGALREIASGSFGQVLIGILAVGLLGYVVWRLIQALFDPEADVTDEGDAKRWAKRAFFLASAVIYGLLTWYAVDLLFGGSTGGSGAGGAGAGATGGGSGSSGATGGLLSKSWGRWVVGGLGVAIIVRGLLQLVKAYTGSFKEKIESFDLPGAKRSWVLTASRIGLTARGVVFGILGGSFVAAAVQYDTSKAADLDQVLGSLRDTPWLLGLIGAGLVCYAIYQWVKARYRLIGA